MRVSDSGKLYNPYNVSLPTYNVIKIALTGNDKELKYNLSSPLWAALLMRFIMEKLHLLYAPRRPNIILRFDISLSSPRTVSRHLILKNIKNVPSYTTVSIVPATHTNSPISSLHRTPSYSHLYIPYLSVLYLPKPKGTKTTPLQS